MPQDSRFFFGTIAENISGFARDRDERLLLNAVSLAGLRDFLAATKSGLDTPIDAMRPRLSAGICQKLALARAIYRNPHLLILDDPTIRLDRDGRRCLSHVLQGHRNNGGVALICTNDQPLLLRCDRILVLAIGRPPRMASREDIVQRDDIGLAEVPECDTTMTRN
jgi:ATP-binding cassette, subfamily C, bacterial exporter for protease/lipase